MMPSPHDLKYFREAASTLNMSRAAERLGISQPSLSLAMQRIEESLGAKVFFRSKRGLALTQAGKQLLSHTNSLLDAWNQVKSQALASSQEIQGRYVIGCHASVALYSLGGFLPKVLRDHPMLDIKLVHDLSRKITESVISSAVDIGIVVNPVKHPDLIITKLANDDVTLWRSQSLSDLNMSDLPFIVDPDLIQSQAVLKKAAKIGMRTERAIETKSLEVAADLTAHGCGIGILPTRVAERAVKPLQKIKMAPTYRDEICMIIRSEAKNIAAIRYLVGSIKLSFSR
jgi:DNA-binding transcriptional LysR family regulator